MIQGTAWTHSEYADMSKRVDRSIINVSSVTKLIQAANSVDAGLMLFDEQDRVTFSNSTNNRLFDFIDFSETPSYEDTFRASLRFNRFVEPEAYNSPDQWLNSALTFRRNHRFAQFTKEYPNHELYMVTHERIPGIGSYFSRINMTRRMQQSIADPNALLGPDTWSGAIPHLPWTIRGSLSDLPTATAIVTETGVVVEESNAMKAVLDHRDGLSLVNGRMVAGLPSENDTLQRLFEGRRPKGRNWAHSGDDAFMRIGREGDEHPYLVKVTPCETPAGLPRLNTVVVLDLSPAETPEVPASVWRVLYKLTPAEARVAASVGRGKDLQATAEQNGTEASTARVHLRSIFAKTGLHRQSDLIRLFTSIAAMFHAKIRR